MTPQPIAEPAGGPSSARIETCGTCGRRITRPDPVRGRWRHDDRVVTAPVGPSYYGPNPSIRCASCGTTDADLFPGRVREWDA
jgi:hypothetical protein